MADVRKNISIREIPKVNKFSVTGIKDAGVFFYKNLRVIVNRSIQKIRITG